MSEYNLLLDTDSYKYTHAEQYPPKTTYVHSYLESRGGKFSSTVFFGLQYILKKYLAGTVVTREQVDYVDWLVGQHIGPNIFNRDGWLHIVNRHGGRLPVSIRAVPEGTEVPTSNVLMTIENTDPECYWLTNFLETSLLRVWYPITVATLSHQFKKLWLTYLQETGSPEQIDFKLHDFGCRGVSSLETAGIGGLAHLLSFKGTDTVPALQVARDFYRAGVAGFSIPASEHSTMTSWGSDRETDAYRNMLKKFPKGLVAVVSDSYDIRNAVTNIWGGVLKDDVLYRDGTLVVRPDSGHPPTIVLDVIRRLDSAFGCTTNDKGYKVLNDHVRVIQGDGIDYEMAETILRHLMAWGYSADNLAMGMGGALLQRLDRDTQKFAIKASSVVVDGEERDVAKNPSTDSSKKSKAGKLKLIRTNTGFATVKGEAAGEDQLIEVFRNGELLREYTLDECRAQLESSRIPLTV